jgi:uncharacterized MAPEG superfamily protein
MLLVNRADKARANFRENFNFFFRSEVGADDVVTGNSLTIGLMGDSNMSLDTETGLDVCL